MNLATPYQFGFDTVSGNRNQLHVSDTKTNQNQVVNISYMYVDSIARL